MRILVVSTADWDHPFWTNKQHVTQALAALGHDILYVESLGIRSYSSESVQDTRRIFRRLSRCVRRPRQLAERVSVVSPLVLPMWSKASVVLVNRVLMVLQLAFWKITWGQWDAVWTYSPITPAAMRLGRVPVLYHCVDNISAQPLMPKAAIDRFEKELVSRADLIYSTAPELTRRLERMGAKGVVEHTNVVDFAHFANSELLEVNELRDGFRPRIGFVGALSRYKVDLDLLKKVAETFPDCDIVLVGQIGEGQPGEKLEELQGFDNVQFMGPQPYERLPEIMSSFDVALLPVPINEYTRSMFPMKFFEYLASGVPVVSTAIPSLLKFGTHAFFTETHDEFLDSIRSALNASKVQREQGRALASNFTYKKRTADMHNALQHIMS